MCERERDREREREEEREGVRKASELSFTRSFACSLTVKEVVASCHSRAQKIKSASK